MTGRLCISSLTLLLLCVACTGHNHPRSVLDPTGTGIPVRTYAERCPDAATLRDRAQATPTVIRTTAPTRLSPDISVDPPSSAVHPGVTAQSAFVAAKAASGGLDPGPHPTITFGLVSTTGIDHRAAWVFVLTDTTVIRISNGPAPIPGSPTTVKPPCYLGTVIIPVDASTGEALGSHASSVAGW